MAGQGQDSTLSLIAHSQTVHALCGATKRHSVRGMCSAKLSLLVASIRQYLGSILSYLRVSTWITGVEPYEIAVIHSD